MHLTENPARNRALRRQPSTSGLLAEYRAVRAATERLCAPLAIEDYVIQSMPDVSPTKWHLGHTTWFFETFVLARVLPGYCAPHPQYAVLFNSYYNSIGRQHSRPQRGLLSRPTVDEVMAYRGVVDGQIEDMLIDSSLDVDDSVLRVIELGLQHEQQHQELMLMDIKHVFWSNPLRPVYRERPRSPRDNISPIRWLTVDEELRWIGHDGAGCDSGFAYDNEEPRHREFVPGFQVADRLVTCGQYLEFIEDGGYRRPELWLSDGWTAVQEQDWIAPLYWEKSREGWQLMTLGGMQHLNSSEPVCHVSFYEADAFARWSGAVLPSEAAWETVAEGLPIEGNFVESERLHPLPPSGAASEGPQQLFGDAWEWTSSPYIAYPGYRSPDGALGEYNSKFMCNQMVLRGGCCATPISHIRTTYRNFYPPDARWPFSGIRLARPFV